MSNDSLKSVHITNYYHKNSGGISNAYNQLLAAANRHRRFVSLIVPGAKNETEEVGEFGRIHYVYAKPFPLFDQRYRVMQAWNTYMFNETPIRQILYEEMPDIIEIAEKYSLSLLAGIIRKGFYQKIRKAHRPMLVHFTCERMDDNMRSFVSGTKPFMWFCKRVMGNYNFAMFDFHIGNSHYTAQELLDAVLPEKNKYRSDRFLNFCWRYFHAPQAPAEERVFVNFCGVDSEHFNIERQSSAFRQQIMQEYNLPPDAKILLYAGRISPEKNVGLLVDLMQKLKKENANFFMLIAGDGPKADWLKKQMDKKAAGTTRFLGHLTDREKLANLFANADVFVHPNPREPFGIAPLEAMASGIPVVAPNSGGVRSYASDENAWLVEPTAEQFAAAIRSIFDASERRKMKIVNALQTSKEHTWEDSTNRLFALYDQMYEIYCNSYEKFDYQIDPQEIDFASQLSLERKDLLTN